MERIGAGIDHFADARLADEVARLQQQGFAVDVALPDDPAYGNPEAMREVYDYLEERQQRFAEVEETPSRWEPLLQLVYARAARRLIRRRAARNSQRRYDLLFNPEKTDSWAWQRQHGRATAPLTVSVAHETDLQASPAYKRMGGPLDRSVLEFRFPETAAGVGGLPVKDALVHAERRFSRKTLQQAASKAEQRIRDTGNFLDYPVSPEFRKVIQHCFDAIGIRERAGVVSGKLLEYIAERQRQGSEPSSLLMASIGCGTAFPIFRALASVQELHGQVPRLVLIDQDPLALAAAGELARHMGLQDSIEIHCVRLFDSLRKPLSLDAILKGRLLDIAEDSGLREYLPRSLYIALTRTTWAALAPGGLMSSGNMNSHRPQPEVLHGVFGWYPNVAMRSISEGFELHRRAGISAGLTSATVTGCGVYTMYFSRKPGSNQ